MAEEATVIGRLKTFIDSLGYSNSQFADKAGIPRPTLSQLVHGRNKSVSDTLLRKLYESFPSLNITWLLFGQGEMLNDSNIKISEPQNSGISAGTNEQDAYSQRIESLFPGFEDEIDDLETGENKRHNTSGTANGINFGNLEDSFMQSNSNTHSQPAGSSYNSSGDTMRKKEDLLNEIVMPLQMPSTASENTASNDSKADKRIKSIIVLYTDSSFEVFSSES